MIIFHDPRAAEYSRAGHPDAASRITRTGELLRERHPGWLWKLPEIADGETLLRAHSAAHLARVAEPEGDFDADCPAYGGIYEHAARASGAAVAAARGALHGEAAFTLMRPPGHHATRDRAMGFCYFNHMAVAALDALRNGAERVAIWDFDAHHGNGTEAIIASNVGILFASVHQFPAYPGTGARSFGNVINIPLAPGTPREQHMSALRDSLAQLLSFAPDLLLVSAGFDGYRGDPITDMTLEHEDFGTIGNWLHDANVRTAAILEGGYSGELPELIDHFLTAWRGN